MEFPVVLPGCHSKAGSLLVPACKLADRYWQFERASLRMHDNKERAQSAR
jgi:hypothetical protein